jgi:hypothetical protein
LKVITPLCLHRIVKLPHARNLVGIFEGFGGLIEGGQVRLQILKEVARLMREYHLHARVRRSFVRTTNSKHGLAGV